MRSFGQRGKLGNLTDKKSQISIYRPRVTLSNVAVETWMRGILTSSYSDDAPEVIQHQKFIQL